MEDLAAQVLINPSAAPTPAARQTTREAPELEIAPEYEMQYATTLYPALASPTRRWPWRFPFDIDYEKRGILLRAISLPRTTILNAVAEDPSVYDLGIAALDLSAGQLDCLTTSVAASTTYNAARTALRAVPTMMQNSSLTFQEVYALTQITQLFSDIGAPAMNPPLQPGPFDSATWPAGASACDPSTYTLNDATGSTSPMTEPQAERIHRFVRLARVLRWPWHLIDWAIGGFSLEAEGTSSTAFRIFPLKWLGAAELIRSRLKLKPHEVIGFWTDLSTIRWDLPFVASKSIPSPWEQVFRVPLADLTLTSAARAVGVSEPLATQLAGGHPFDATVASTFFRYGRLARALPNVRPEHIATYEELVGTQVFASPESTWQALEDFDAVRRSGTRLSNLMALYTADPRANAPLDNRTLLRAVEDLNRRSRISTGAFAEALGRFISESTASVVEASLAGYAAAATPADIAALDANIPELLDAPSLATPPLSSEADDQARKARILAAVRDRLWNAETSTLLERASRLDAASVSRLANTLVTSDGSTTIVAALKAMVGNGGAWSGWPTPTHPSPDAQESFLDEGLFEIPVATTAAVSVAAKYLVGASGSYELRYRVDFADGGNVLVEGSGVSAGETNVLEQFRVEDDDSGVRSITLSIECDVACTVQLELVDPSGNAARFPGVALYSDTTLADPTTVRTAREALDLMQLAGTAAAQWHLTPDDLAQFVMLHGLNVSFPQFPPHGAVARPIEGANQDADGFAAALEFARLVAAVRLTSGEARQRLYDAAIAAQAVATTAAADIAALAESVWAAVARALSVEESCVSDGVESLLGTDAEQALEDFAAGRTWLKLFDLSRTLQEYGVRADTLVAWGAPTATSAAVTSLEASARARLAGQRSADDRLRDAIDSIRVLKRDALADFLLANPPTGQTWLTRADISDYLLTDIEMEPCAQTSRVRFAIAACQRLVTQALAQAENLQLTADQEGEWTSVAQYRLWEVRQRILLYPESWLRFGRHLHPSPEYEELSRAFLQGELTDEKAVEALTRYVEQLHEVGHLEIVGTCLQQEYDVTGALSVNRFHVIGRTPAEPRTYYHRERVDESFWTAWTKIELDIDCDQIVPVVHNRQLHLFWLVEEMVAQSKPNVHKDDRQIALDDKYKTLRLAWSVLTSKGWRSKRISKGSLSTRFGHYAANASSNLGTSTAYLEVHGWNQAVQDSGTYQLRPALSPEGDAMLEIYAPPETTVLATIQSTVSDWVYQTQRIVRQLGGGSAINAWVAAIEAQAASARDTLFAGIRAPLDVNLRYATPGRPGVPTSGQRTSSLTASFLIGTFRLTPDNLVDIRQRSAESNTEPSVLPDADRARRAPRLGTAVARHGAFEFDDGSVELHCGSDFRTVLGTAGTPVRLVITRQEQIPSQTDPVFCRIKNRSFFAAKEVALPPPLILPVYTKGNLTLRSDPFAMRRLFQSAPREHVARAAAATAGGDVTRTTGTYAVLRLANTSQAMANAPLDPGVAFGMGVAARLATSTRNALVSARTGAWRFGLAHHPQTIELLRAVRAGLPHLYDRDTEVDARAATGSLTVPFVFDADYDPIVPWVDIAHLPVDELEFKVDQAYSQSNWELLCHAPMALADQCLRTGQFAEARTWITRVFNPRDPRARDATGTLRYPENFWVFKPFHDFVQGDGIGDFQNLSPLGDSYEQKVFRGLLKQWRANPFNPHAVAAFRPQAYLFASVFLYVETLIAGGDDFMGVPSAELVERAARLYEEAERVIGRPSPSTGAIRYDTATASVADLDAGALGSAVIENAFTLSDGPSANVEDAFLPDLAIGYFCLPPNPKINELRNRIQDRLFKVHHCLDLLGNPRKLPLYDPPIDPALLADAAMAGLNVSQAVIDAYAPRPHYRFRTLLGIAKGLIQHAMSLGSGLLSAMEKRDAEALALLKQTHEAKVLERATAVRKLQVEDAEAAAKALEATRVSVDFRRDYYATREFMNAEESAQITLSLESTIFRIIGQGLSAASSAAGAVPDITTGGAGAMGSPVAVVKTGGENFSRVSAGLALAMNAVGDLMGTFSGIAGSMGSYRRRKEDWDFQAKSAELELKQITAQILGANIRQTIAERELANHEAQLEQSRDELDFVRTKQTSINLYEWLAADIGSTYYRTFQLAHSVALQAQRAMQDELGSDKRYIGFSHWNGAHRGLQAGERLMQDVLEMESQYHAQNARPPAKTVNINLAALDPIALADLKSKGTCSFELPETFWDQHAPGLYHRRFASVAISVPAVVGSFSGVHGRLTIERATYRKDPTVPQPNGDGTDPYLRQQDDPRFVTEYARPGDFILLSTGVRDTGVSGAEAREDRYGAFENLGVDSAWRLDISQRDNTFDLATISDVILHVEYTARDGGTTLQTAARSALASASSAEGFVVSLRQQFAREWQTIADGASVAIDLQRPLSNLAWRRDGRLLGSLSVALLLRLTANPDAGVTTNGQVDLPTTSLSDAGVNGLDPFSFSFAAPTGIIGDGASRFALSVQPLNLTDAGGNTLDLAFEALRSEPWGVRLSPIAGQEFEDAMVCVTWTLRGQAVP
jgi:hypothetical protein